MDINKTGNTIRITANEKDNKINVERKGNITEVSIDGKKQEFKGNNEIVIDAGAGNDTISVTNLPGKNTKAPMIKIIGGDGDDDIVIKGNNIKVEDNKGTNIILNYSPKVSAHNSIREAQINEYISEINLQFKDKHYLEVEEKDKILEILNRSAKDGSLPELVNNLDHDKKLEKIYKAMGTLADKGSAGAVTSSLLMIFTLGISTVAEADMNRSRDMLKLMKDTNVPDEILYKLDPIRMELLNSEKPKID